MAKLFKKKSEEPNQDAAVSSIPVPPADSALVIDLPEGQKLVLGKMEEGTVIEVATWRGTGRPDSRTNRLMLGVSFGGTATPESPKSDEVQLENLSGYQKYLFIVQGFLSKIFSKLKERISQLWSAISKLPGKLRDRKKLDDYTSAKAVSSPTESNEDFDVDKWLDSIRSKSRVAQLERSSESKEPTLPKKTERSKKKAATQGHKSKKGRK